MSADIQTVEFRPGEILFYENENSFHFFIIQEGEVEVYKSGARGQKIPLAVVGPGTSIGEFAMIDRLPRSATARARTLVKAARVSDEAYQQLIAELPEWAISVMKALVERLRHTNEIVRRGNIVDARAKAEIDAVEYDPEASTVSDSNPFLKKPEDDGPD